MLKQLVQADNMKLQEDVSQLTQDKELVELRLRSYEKENTLLAPTLEETQWEVSVCWNQSCLCFKLLRELKPYITKLTNIWQVTHKQTFVCKLGFL